MEAIHLCITLEICLRMMSQRDPFQERKNQIKCEDVYQWASPREIIGAESGLLPNLSISSLNHLLNKKQNKGKYTQ